MVRIVTAYGPVLLVLVPSLRSARSARPRNTNRRFEQGICARAARIGVSLGARIAAGQQALGDISNPPFGPRTVRVPGTKIIATHVYFLLHDSWQGRYVHV